MGSAIGNGSVAASGACLEKRVHPRGKPVRRGVLPNTREAVAAAVVSSSPSLAERVTLPVSSNEEVIQASSEVERLPHEILSKVAFHVGASFPLVSKTFNKAWKDHVKDLTSKVGGFDPSSALSEKGLYKKYPAHQSRIEHLKKTHDGLKKEVSKDQWNEIIGQFPVILSRTHFAELRRVVDQNRQDHASQVLRDALVKSMPGVDIPLDLVRFRLWISSEDNAPHLNRITSLSLSASNLKIVPCEIQYLTQLQLLDLSKNQIEILPPEMGALTSLVQLVLDNNQIKVIPHWIGDLNKLMILNLNYNQIEILPSEMGALTSLFQLILDNNQIKVIPHWIGDLNELIILKLDYNQIKVIPPEMGALTRINILELSHNQIEVIPSEIVTWSHLQFIHLYHNQIEVIPPEIYNMHRLGFFSHGSACSSLGSMVRLYEDSLLKISALGIGVISLFASWYFQD